MTWEPVTVNFSQKRRRFYFDEKIKSQQTIDRMFNQYSIYWQHYKRASMSSPSEAKQITARY